MSVITERFTIYDNAVAFTARVSRLAARMVGTVSPDAARHACIILFIA